MEEHNVVPLQSRKTLSFRKTKNVMIHDSDSTIKDKDVGATTSSHFAMLRNHLIHKMSDGLRKSVGVLSSHVLTAYMGFRDPKRRRREYLIPKDKAAWLEWMVSVARRHVNVEYLNDKELRKVIVRARPNLSPYKNKGHGPVDDPDLPPCLSWNEEQVAEWVASNGWPQLKDTFIKNVITGRKLVLVDCAALNKMGMTDLTSMREVAGKIRQLLGIPPSNQLRPLMRIPPFERFLRRKVYNGRNYDELTFEKFCEVEGFNYELIAKNKNMLIPCTTEVMITTPEHADEDEGAGDSDEDHSLRNAPTVEFLVRNALVRNKTVDQIMEDIMESVFLPPRERKYGKDVWGQLKRGIGEGYDDLYLYYPKQRLEFATGVADSLIDELYKTVAVLNDISQCEKYINENMSKEDMDMFRSCAQTLMEEALPIVSLLALGELELETIFRQEPEFQKFTRGIVREVEERTNALVPDAEQFVDEVIAEAFKRLPNLDLPGLNPDKKKSLLKMSENMINHIRESRSDPRKVSSRAHHPSKNPLEHHHHGDHHHGDHRHGSHREEKDPGENKGHGAPEKRTSNVHHLKL